MLKAWKVEHLSLSRKILFYVSDYFIFQWLALKEKHPKLVYLRQIGWWISTYSLEFCSQPYLVEKTTCLFQRLLQILRIIGGEE